MAGSPLLVVLGNACSDAAYRVGSLPVAGETVIAQSVAGDLGGKGLNQAVAAARAGVVPQFIAPVGRDGVADRIAAALRHEGIGDGDLIRCDGASDSSVILIDAGGENVIVSDTRQAEALGFDRIAPLLRLSPGHLLLVQGNLSMVTTQAAVAAARAAGAMVAMNAAPLRGWLRDMLPDVLPDVLIANRGEAAGMAGLAVDAPIADMLVALPSAVVAITLGAGGCLLRDHGALIHIAAPAVAVQDSAGAGDVFAGVFTAGVLATGDAVGAARLAVLAASAKVARAGTLSAFPTRTEIDRLRHSPGSAPRPSGSSRP